MHYTTPMLRQLRATIGHNIHHLRRERKLPLRRLARLTGISETVLDQYELGGNNIQLRELLKIAYVLEVEPLALMAA